MKNLKDKKQMPTIEKLTHREKAKLKQLIHNLLNSTKIDNRIAEIGIEQRKKLNLVESVINDYKAEIIAADFNFRNIC